jgi:hypothetical protein
VSDEQQSAGGYHDLLKGCILNDLHGFCSKTFAIRFSDEIVNLNHIVQFRSEIDLHSGYDSTPLYLEVAMLFANLSLKPTSDKSLAQLAAVPYKIKAFVGSALSRRQQKIV